MVLTEGFPDLNVTWSRQQDGSSHSKQIVASDMHFLFSGDYGLNLTVLDVVKSDAGKYFLDVTSADFNVSLTFEVTVLGEWRWWCGGILKEMQRLCVCTFISDSVCVVPFPLPVAHLAIAHKVTGWICKICAHNIWIKNHLLCKTKCVRKRMQLCVHCVHCKLAKMFRNNCKKYRNLHFFHSQNFRLAILHTTLISYGAVLYENISDAKILSMWKIWNCMPHCYLYTNKHTCTRDKLSIVLLTCAMLSHAHMQGIMIVHVFWTRDLSISELEDVSCEKIINGR